MPTAASEDTEITLGTGKMLALFFALVALCAVFFAAGFSLGKQAALKPSAAEAMTPTPAAAVIRPVTAKTSSSTPSPALENAAKTTDSQPAPDNAAANGNAPSPSAAATAPDPTAPPVLNGYYVQVAAVTKQEDADALVDALKSKQYPAFSATAPSDKLLHVQCGPYADIKDAEALRGKLISDGYNPILKK
ncbi:MAG TPA: SPOR domain-containing protein [Terriglobales bacterium]|nr:SPOR domain-containing protein [Terriglobales bacterium]